MGKCPLLDFARKNTLFILVVAVNVNKLKQCDIYYTIFLIAIIRCLLSEWMKQSTVLHIENKSKWIQ